MKLLLAATTLSLLACDTGTTFTSEPSSAAVGDVGSTEAPEAIEAIEALGPERHVEKVTALETERAVQLVETSRETRAMLSRLVSEGFDFGTTATAFWLQSESGRVTTVLFRGRRDGEQTLVATVLSSERVLGAFEVEGEGEGFAVYGDGFTYLAQHNTFPNIPNSAGAECHSRRALIDAGGELQGEMCRSEANFLCFWQHLGEKAAFEQCVARRAAACDATTSCE